MDARAFYGLEPTADPAQWSLPIVQSLCSGLGHLFGGCGLGACVEALEQVTGRPLVWATGQYLSYARPPDVLEIRVDEVVRGRQVSQARAVGRVGDDDILTVNAAFGHRDVEHWGQWAERPDVPPPDTCPPPQLLDRHESTIMDRLDMRMADARTFDELDGRPGSGRSSLWVRMPGLLEMSAAALAIVGDYVPFGISQALGARAGGNSLDNTLRIAHVVPTEWVLADIRVHTIQAGFGHGLVHLWAENGTLLGTASQSTIVRAWRDGPSPTGEKS
ncbi:MAG: thioesterase family protein [Actinobacteria bacterium]|nr:thioesterase family protein [Actinomycetota bacterium]